MNVPPKYLCLLSRQDIRKSSNEDTHMSRHVKVSLYSIVVLLLVYAFVFRPIFRQSKRAKANSEMAWMIASVTPQMFRDQSKPFLQVHKYIHAAEARIAFRDGVLIDPWNTQYDLQLISEGSRLRVVVTSAGPDLKFGTLDDLTKSVEMGNNLETNSQPSSPQN